MLDAEQIRALIYRRVNVCSESCNSYHMIQCIGEIRGMLAVLNDGDPLVHKHMTHWSKVLDGAGIPYVTNTDGSLFVTDDWVLSHGFDADGKPVAEWLKKGW